MKFNGIQKANDEVLVRLEYLTHLPVGVSMQNIRDWYQATLDTHITR
jgi:hypothetical protein